ncbi:MAG: prepilin-type N-terminal cleavage/methylation domain-containing protein [Leptolyngbya sp. PLA1]|nr:prepilin-type N-terminal cleavage/methylation domain-containing protein [Leptolyngbya sp. PLA1]
MLRRAFTLVEMLVSLATVAVIAGAIMSTMVVAARSLPAAGDRTDRATSARRALAQLTAEVALASEVASLSASSIEFTHPDVDGDKSPDLIRYEWGGKAGDGLVRTQNGVPTTLLDGLADFSLVATTRDARIEGAGSSELGAEQLLASFDDDHTSELPLGLTDAQAQYVRPLLPSNATHFAVTRVEVRARRGGSTAAVLNAAIHADSNGPALLALQSSTLTASGAKGTSGLFPATFPVPVELPAGTGVWIVISSTLGTSDALCAKSPVANGLQKAASGTKVLATLTWTQRPEGSLRYKLYGMVRRPTDLQVTRVDAIRVALAIDQSSETHSGGTVLHAAPRLMSVPPLDLLPVKVDDAIPIDLKVSAESGPPGGGVG